MLQEQVVDSVMQARDSIVFPASLIDESVSRMPAPPLDTLSNYIGLVEGTPLKDGDISFTSGLLVYIVAIHPMIEITGVLAKGIKKIVKFILMIIISLNYS